MGTLPRTQNTLSGRSMKILLLNLQLRCNLKNSRHIVLSGFYIVHWRYDVPVPRGFTNC